MGRTAPLAGEAHPALCTIGRPPEEHSDGAVAGSAGQIWGTYLHGLFDNDPLRHAWLRSLGWRGDGQRFDRELAYNRLAAHVRQHLDMSALRRIVFDDYPRR
jgi:adenosylcobyric acid synthase